MRWRHRVGTTIAVLIAVVMLVAGSAEVGMAEKADLSSHRNLFNGDFGFFFWNSEMWQEGDRYTAAAIHRAVDNLVDNGVDTVILNPNSRVAWYPSSVIPTVLDRYTRDGLPSYSGGNWFCRELLNPALDLKEDGVDWLHEAVTQCHNRGVSVWASIRMSDPHTSPSYYLSPPGCLGSNYGSSAVRAQYLTFATELVNDYDFDGLELDWLRCPDCSASTAEMTAWYASVRGLVDAKAAQTGRPFRLGMRLPESQWKWSELGIGTGGDNIITNGTLDYICPSNFMQTTWNTPHDDLKQAFGDDVTIYGVTGLWINESYVWSDELNRHIAPYVNSSPPHMRANAAGKLVLGADGIQQYNFFVGDLSRKYDVVPGVRSCYEALQNLDDLEALRGLSKCYSVCSDLRNGPSYDLPKPLPETLGSGEELALRLPMCAETGYEGELTIQLVVGRQEGLDQDITVCFGGVLCLEDAEPTMELLFPLGPANRLMSEYQGYNYRFPIDLIEDGWNDIVLLNAAGQSVTIYGVELSVAPIPEPGDANKDGIVDDQDASILAAHWQAGPGAGWGDGDFNGDGYVDDQDASILAAHWQETHDDAAPIPEPAAGLLLLIGGLHLVGFCRGKSANKASRRHGFKDSKRIGDLS